MASALTATAANQALATAPDACAWVSANAGTGKTYVLVRRVLRCFLSGAPPEAVLCLTFTKAAAAEMSNRLLGELAKWAVAPEGDLRDTLASLIERAPLAAECARARALFAEALDAPGGLKIMTIHSFCDRVLRRFPLEAGLAPGFSIMTDDEARGALREAISAALEAACGGADETLGEALSEAVAHAGEDGFHALLQEAVGKRHELSALIAGQSDVDPFAGIRASLCAAFGIGPETAERMREAQAGVCSAWALSQAGMLQAAEKPTDRDLGTALAAATAAQSPQERRKALHRAFMTQAGEPRSERFITQAVRKAHPALAEALTVARDEFARLETASRAAETVAASVALLRLADAVMSRYEAGKQQRAAADYQDLIAKTLQLLSRENAAWVLYQLDGAIRHVMIDEAQDTNPEQWELVKRLTEDFFSGEGAADGPRTIFAVGDEKQSIFGFQGAEPRRFAEMGQGFSQQALAAGMAWRDVPLNLSFRTVAPVLQAVDLTFNGLEGLTHRPAPIRHAAHREEDGGLVEIWPPESASKLDKGDAWRPLDDAGAEKPAQERLAMRIADRIKLWLDRKEILASHGRPIEAGDILILLKKREPFARLIIRALQERGIPAAGADRLKLSRQIAILDLMRLGDCLLQPADDLALACALKSPLFGWDDEALFGAAHGREGSLWQALQAHPPAQETAATLARWRESAAQLTPFAFYAGIIDGEGFRPRFLARLGDEAGDAIDEFLNLALNYEERFAPSLQGFLGWLRDAQGEIKRDLDQGRNEVRVMTVHGAKGLEANIVFLADTCSTRSRNASALIAIPDAGLPPSAAPLLVWAIPPSKTLGPVKAARETAKQADASEYKRLLYVAMTRARDRLYVTGFEGAAGRGEGCWYDLIRNALEGHALKVETPDGDSVWRLERPQMKAPPPPAAPRPALYAPPPDWLNAPAPISPARRAIRPSAAREGLAIAGREAVGAAGGANSRERAALRGALIHKLLEWLPETPPERWEAASARFLAGAEAFGPSQLREIQSVALGILRDPGYAALFGARSRGEASFAALISPQLFVSGRIDRFAEAGHEILIADFKTGGNIPPDAGRTDPAHVSQLALYRMALQKLFPEKHLRAFLLFTQGPSMLEIPGAILDEADKRLLRSVGAAS